ncbi:hypothetical protein QR98_0008730 [Sarcoptes scabiei]|uniref:Uncharacterized protein n=1 Tax=Sarcoptes scabiei TaxID=52283 RepID=A0A131ZVE6_SARSC|nr:hypothetical protein QR98_0008730 [Sarcoptes scabiei]
MEFFINFSLKDNTDCVEVTDEDDVGEEEVIIVIIVLLWPSLRCGGCNDGPLLNASKMFVVVGGDAKHDDAGFTTESIKSINETFGS